MDKDEHGDEDEDGGGNYTLDVQCSGVSVGDPVDHDLVKPASLV
jgi:hypothetical protein